LKSTQPSRVGVNGGSFILFFSSFLAAEATTALVTESQPAAEKECVCKALDSKSKREGLLFILVFKRERERESGECKTPLPTLTPEAFLERGSSNVASCATLCGIGYLVIVYRRSVKCNGTLYH
jgi:hypothetical protein